MMRASGPLLLALLNGASISSPVSATVPPGVAALLKQAHYWQSKGRGDMAQKVLQRVLAIDPGNAQAKAALTGPAPAPAPVKTDAARPLSSPSTSRPAPSANDPGGNARAVGFAALNRGDLATAASRFEAALAARPGDADATGGLGIVRLRARRFAEARDLLERASARGDRDKWAEALSAASFYAGLDKARAALKAGRLQEAEALARPLAATTGEGHQAGSLLLADILSAEGRNGDAAALYEQAGAIGGPGANDARAQAARESAEAAAARGDLAGAASSFLSAIAADSDNAWLRYDYASFLLDHGHKPDAVAAMAPLAGLTSPDAIYASALFDRRIGTPLNAAALMEQIPPDRLTPPMKALLVDLKMDEALERIRALKAQGNIPAALAGARDLAAAPTASVATLGATADLLQSMGDNADAESAALQAVQRPLASPEDYQSVVSVLVRAGHDTDATILISRLAGQGGAPAATGRLGAILAANQADRLRLAGQNAAAFDVLRNAWAGAPSDQDILASLARLYQGGGMPAQAQQVYAMLLRQKPEDLPSLIGFAQSAAAAHDFDPARDAIGRAIALAPKDPSTYLAAADVEQARGDKGAALRYLKQARALSHTTMLADGVFPAANPFGPAGSGANPFAADPSAAANPFALPATANASAAPMPVSYAAVMPVPQAGTIGFAPPSAVASTTMPLPAPQPGAPATASTDPTLARIDQEIAQLSGDSGPALKATANFRNRSGEEGLSRLNQIGASISASTTVGGVKVTASAAPVVLDSGSLSRSALARFGTNPTAEAIGIQTQEPSALVAAKTQHDAGISPSVEIEAGSVEADVGATPLGFRKTNLQGGASVSPKVGQHVTLGLHGERRPVTDSVLSYAGAVDPVTGLSWGSVMQTGGGGSISYDRNGNGIYVDGGYHRYNGRNVLSNRKIEGNIGGYLKIYGSGNNSLTAGANLNYQSYGNDQNYFSFGHGGYFSPQSFVSIAFPLHYKTDRGKWQAGVDLAPGFQSYQEDGASVYPTLVSSQAELDRLKALNSDVRASYDSLSKSGFAFSGAANGSYQVGSATRIGGEVKYDTFGAYKEFQTMLSIRQSLGGDGR